MYLAEKLGHANVDRMLDEITPQQFAEWQAYYTLGGADGGNR